MARWKKDHSRRNQILIGVVLVFLMVMSGFGIMSRSDQNAIWYGKHKFEVNSDGRFMFLKHNNHKIDFYNHPEEIKELAAPAIVKEVLAGKDYMIVTFEPEQNPNNLAVVDKLRIDLETYFSVIVIPGTTHEDKLYSFYVFTCENASSYIPVIYFSESNETSLEVQGDCITAQGKAAGFLSIRDFLLYSMIGVFDEK